MVEYLDYLEYLELGQFRNFCDVLCNHFNHKNDVNNFYLIYPTSRGDSNLYPGNGPCKLQQCPRLLALSRLYLCEVVVRWMGYGLFIRFCFYLTVYLSQECLVVIGGWTGCILRIIFRVRIRHEYNAYIYMQQQGSAVLPIFHQKFRFPSERLEEILGPRHPVRGWAEKLGSQILFSSH